MERANGYLETSFLPGQTFAGPGDFNTQLTAWLQNANRRRHRTIDARPLDRWETDRAAMLAIPPVRPPTWWPLRTRLGRDHYIRVDTNDYSVHPRAISHLVTVQADTEEITVTCGEGMVAHHARCWARHQSITDPSTPPRPGITGLTTSAMAAASGTCAWGWGLGVRACGPYTARLPFVHGPGR
nr:hypothetical protein [Streptomyces sp. TLI_235]